MTRTDRSNRLVPDLEASTVRRAAGAAVALAGLLFLLGLAALLSGVDRLVAALSVPAPALLSALATLLVVGTLAFVAPAAGTAVRRALDAPEPVARHADAGATLLVGFAAVVIAYRGLAGVALPLLAAFDLAGVYHLGFLAAGALVLGALARRLARCREPAADLLAARLAGGDRREPPGSDTSPR